ncbi:MAG: outer membrane protein transport protein [Muribaculaceae bacterium]|nr:outer membrane protein transport protein [Muribaculaceae bacterium]
MKKTLRSGIAAGLFALPLLASAQSAIDANELNGSDVRGTARFVAMGGAFTSLGGDLSSMTQNPAGLGLYRRNEIGLTFDIEKRNYSSETATNTFSNSKTRGNFDNFGYVGTAMLGSSALRSLSWGVSYQRLNSFHRRHQGYNIPTETSLSNYIASFTTAPGSDLDFGTNYNPYLDSSEDWLSILGYTSYMINPTGGPGMYQGLHGNNTYGDAAYVIEETGYQDEYNIDFAGNVSDIVYWGIGLGIQDISYSRRLLYSESMEDARIHSERYGTIATGDAGFDLDSYKTIDGSGVNLKVGVIVRPTDDFRVGLAVHTPTWLHLNHQGDAEVNYSYYDPNVAEYSKNPLAGREYTNWYDYDSRLRSPWRIMFGASYTIASKAIVSVDYERVQYQDMHMKYQTSDAFGYTFVTDEAGNADVKSYFKGGDIVRVGAEYRVTPQFSVRAGYNYQTSHVREATTNAGASVYTAGVDPSYSLGKDTGNLSFGLGYRYKSWYIDCAYQWKHQESTFHAYTDFEGFEAPKGSMTDNIHSFVISTGFKF